MRIWVLALLFVPVASAAPVDLYAHVDGYQDMPLTTQVPERPSDYGAPLGMGSGCISDPLSMQRLTDRNQHTWYAYIQSEAVTYTDEGLRGYSRGMGQDLRLTAAEATWFLRVDHAELEAVPLNDFVLRTTIREGDDISVGQEAYNTGVIVAQGETEPFLLHPEVDHPGLTHHEVDGGHVYGITVPMALQQPVINATEGFNVRIDAYVDTPACPGPGSSEGGDYLNPVGMHMIQADGLYNHLSLDVEQAITWEAIHPQIVKEDLVIHLEASSPFGGYDALAEFVFDETPAGWSKVAQVTYTNCHCPPDPKSRWTYYWGHEQAEPGEYPFQLRLTNLQGTATETMNGTLHFDGKAMSICFDDGCFDPHGADQKAPGVPLAALLVALVVLARRISK